MAVGYAPPAVGISATNKQKMYPLRNAGKRYAKCLVNHIGQRRGNGYADTITKARVGI